MDKLALRGTIRFNVTNVFSLWHFSLFHAQKVTYCCKNYNNLLSEFKQQNRYPIYSDVHECFYPLILFTVCPITTSE